MEVGPLIEAVPFKIRRLDYVMDPLIIAKLVGVAIGVVLLVRGTYCLLIVGVNAANEIKKD